MTKRKNNLIAVILFVAVFAVLLITATFADLQISHILTAKSLADHTYITNDAFAASFEAFGSAPVYLLLSFSFLILFWYLMRTKNWPNAVKFIGSIAMLVCTAVSNFVLVSDTTGYLLDHTQQYLLGQTGSDVGHAGFVRLIEVSLVLLLTVLGALAVKNFSDESIEKLVRFAFAAIALAAVSTVVLHLIKGPVGRIRYRAMNMYPDDEKYGFAAFARWFQINGQWIDKATMKELFGTTDALKSFPSGHTCAAAASYGFTMLGDALEIKNKKVRAALWIVPIVFTATVAISRIVAGAHFMSDVLVGGTVAFVCMIISREIFICKGENVKALMNK